MDYESMVLIPAGEFQMGSDAEDALFDDHEKLVHTGSVDAFYMDKYAVTNAEYQKYVDTCNL